VIPSHHLDDATLLALATATLVDAHKVVASAHLSQCAHCRETLAGMEQIGGAALETQTEAAVSNTCRAATLASLDGVIQQKKTVVAKRVGALPPVLSALLDHRELDELPWKKKAPGISVFDVPMPKGASGQLKLLSIGSGRNMPEHGHGGEELTLILRGAYGDHLGTYRAGDVADLDEETEHAPVVCSDEPCICLISTEAPAKFKSIWARMAQPFVGI
jgi:putative transcriptional regulator